MLREQDLGSVSLPTPLLVNISALREQRTGSNCRAETCPIVKSLNSSPSSEIGPMCSSVQFLDCSFGNKYKEGLTIDIVFGKMHELEL